MELWVFITISAAFFQTVRTALQKHLKADLSTNAISFTRFIFGLPPACLYAATLLYIYDIPLLAAPITQAPIPFWTFCTIAGIAQIIATSLLVYLFSFKNFMIGTTFVKTEAILTAVLGVILFSEHISLWGFAAILIGILGMMTLSSASENISVTSLLKGITKKEALIGIASGLGFAVASLCLRQASLSLPSDNFILQASMTLVVTLSIQTILMGSYLWIKEAEQWPQLFIHWKKTSLVGLTSMIGSACWFTAFTLTAAAYVKTVGQIEVLFTICMSLFIFKERLNKYEILGVILIISSVVMLIYS